jgi:hypothetical protein
MFRPPLPPRTHLLAEGNVHPNPLASLADLLCLVDPIEGGLLVRIDQPVPTHPDDELILGHKPLDGHPARELLGFVAPDTWWALGVVCPGWANPAGDDLGDVDMDRGRRDGPRYADRPGRRRVRAVSLVARDGAEAARLVLDDDPPIDPGACGEGLIPDCLRRALGLPTAPPAIAVAELWATRWLGEIVAAGEAGCRRVGWAEAAALHPVAEVLAPGRTITHDDLIPAASALQTTVGWADVRARVAAGHWSAPDLSPDVAAWMDDGMFSRWVLGGSPPLEELLNRAAACTSTGTYARIKAAVAATS